MNPLLSLPFPLANNGLIVINLITALLAENGAVSRRRRCTRRRRRRRTTTAATSPFFVAFGFFREPVAKANSLSSLCPLLLLPLQRHSYLRYGNPV